MNPIKISQGGKLETGSKIKVTQKNLAEVYTPGVAQVCLAIKKNPEKARELTWKNRTIAVISDGTAILGLGNIGPEAGLPVMEAKSLLFKQLGGIDAVPIVLNTTNPKEIIKTIKNIAVSFGGINLEDIAAPACFKIERSLRHSLAIPVFHDDQDGTAIVTLAGLINATKVVNKNLKTAKIVISGAGAAGIAIAQLLLAYGCKNITLFDSRGSIYRGRKNLNFIKREIAKKTNLSQKTQTLKEGISGADIFIGVSGPKLLSLGDVKKMNKGAIVFAMANPVPEIMPQNAVKAGAIVVATGRSDFPNQINNALVFPGIFKGALKNQIKLITQKHKLAAANALSNLIKKPTKVNLLPKVTDQKAVEAVAKVFE